MEYKNLYIVVMQKFLLVCVFFLFSCGLHDMLNLDGILGEDKIIEALQEALVLGSKTAASNLGDSSCSVTECVTGYLGNKLVEIALPDTVAAVFKKIEEFSDKLDAMGFTDKLDLLSKTGFFKSANGEAASLSKPASDLNSQYSVFNGLKGYANSMKVALNRGAEKAAPNSIGVFKDAIFGMSFSDAKGVLMGDSIAATSYLKDKTYAGLTSAFAPIIKEPLDVLKPNQYWKPLASGYNSFAASYGSFQNQLKGYSSNILVSSIIKETFGADGSLLPALPYDNLSEDLSGTLATWATGKALDGLFLMVGKQEAKLRADPWGTVKDVGNFITEAIGDLLGDVFSKAK